MSRELLPYVSKLTIDSGRKMAMSRAVRRGKSYDLVFSDHYTCLLTFNDLPRRREGKGIKMLSGTWQKREDGANIKN